jgi:hypothetical protein
MFCIVEGREQAGQHLSMLPRCVVGSSLLDTTYQIGYGMYLQTVVRSHSVSPYVGGGFRRGTDFASKRIISYGLNPILLLGNPFGNIKDRMLKQHA